MASDLLVQVLQRGLPLASSIGTEKVRSELLVAPVLVEVVSQAQQISMFSGIDLNVDAPSGLTGICDFLLSRNPVQHMLTAPVVTLVEAKREDLHEGLGQCVAEMVAAQLFNQKEGTDVTTVYGAVTTGTNWKFLALAGADLTLDRDEYLLDQTGKILGILIAMAQGTMPAGPADAR